jgi:hypothetical protein
MNKLRIIGGKASKTKALNCTDGWGVASFRDNPTSCLAEVNVWMLFRIDGDRRTKSFDVLSLSAICSGISEAKTPQMSTHTIVEKRILIRMFSLRGIT